MIPQEAVLWRIDAYLSREHPELTEWAGHPSQFIVDDLKKYPFFTLAEALEFSGPVYFSHNGHAHLGMPFEELVAYFGVHANPIEIPIRIRVNDLLDGRHECYHRRTIGAGFDGSEGSFFEDTDYRVSVKNVYHRFLEGLFELPYAAFRSAIVGINGLRLDRNGQMGEFADKLLAEGIPLFLDTIKTGEGEDKKAYVINGFEI